MNEYAFNDSKKSDLNLQVHPVILIHIANHYTRALAETKKYAEDKTQVTIEDLSVFGAILGKFVPGNGDESPSFELITAFEALVSMNPKGCLELDENLFQERIDLFDQMFPDLKLVGWYALGGIPRSNDCDLHKKFMERSDSISGICLKYHPGYSHSDGGNGLPFTFFGLDESLSSFIEVPSLDILSDPAELAAIEDLSARKLESETEDEAYIRQLQMRKDVYKKFTSYLNDIRERLNSTKITDSSPEADLIQLLEHTETLMDRMAIHASGGRLEALFDSQYENSMIINYLDSILKCAIQMEESISLVNELNGKSHQFPMGSAPRSRFDISGKSPRFESLPKSK